MSTTLLINLLLSEESCHDEELAGWEHDYNQERKAREVAEAKATRLRTGIQKLIDSDFADQSIERVRAD